VAASSGKGKVGNGKDKGKSGTGFKEGDSGKPIPKSDAVQFPLTRLETLTAQFKAIQTVVDVATGPLLWNQQRLLEEVGAELENAKLSQKAAKSGAVRKNETERDLAAVREKLANNRSLLQEAQTQLDRIASYVASQEAREAKLQEQLRQAEIDIAVEGTAKQLPTATLAEQAIIQQMAALQQQLSDLRKPEVAAPVDKPRPHPAPFGAPIASTFARLDKAVWDALSKDQRSRSCKDAECLENPRRTRSASPGRAKPRNFRELFEA
jgi:hypothetical protein